MLNMVFMKQTLFGINLLCLTFATEKKTVRIWVTSYGRKLSAGCRFVFTFWNENTMSVVVFSVKVLVKTNEKPVDNFKLNR